MILAIDQSSNRAGLALMTGDTVHARQCWTAVRRGADPLFDIWRELLDRSGVAPAAIKELVVGLGPGNYTGLRVSLAAARLWALPGNVPVTGVGSSLAMAVAAVDNVAALATAAMPVVVVGDARRDSVWMVRYPSPVGLHSAEQAPVIVSRAEWLRQSDSEAAIWTSADWERLATPAERALLPGTVLQSPAAPAPEILGRIALYRQRHGMASAPLRPIYLQSPVRS